MTNLPNTQPSNSESELAALATEIFDALADTTSLQASNIANRKKWVDRTIRLAFVLKKAKDMFAGDNKGGNVAFSKWLDENINRKDLKLSKDDRSALINMASDPARARKMLDASQRWSFQQIWRHEGWAEEISSSRNEEKAKKVAAAAGDTAKKVVTANVLREPVKSGKNAAKAPVAAKGVAEPAPAKKSSRETLIAEVSAASKRDPSKAFGDMVMMLADQGLHNSVTVYQLQEALRKLENTWKAKITTVKPVVTAQPPRATLLPVVTVTPPAEKTAEKAASAS